VQSSRFLRVSLPERARLALTIRHGVAPTTVRAGLPLAADKFTGRVPLGADAPTKTLRKVLGGGGELLELLRSLMFGLLALIIGAALIWVGCQLPTSTDNQLTSENWCAPWLLPKLGPFCPKQLQLGLLRSP
jgi:hypothetical protein